MKSLSFIGLLVGSFFIVVSIILDGTLKNFLNVPSAMIVLGGTIASTLISYSFAQIKSIFPMLKKVFSTQKNNLNDDIEKILNLANAARREGLLSLDNETYGDPFVQKGIELIVDGTDPELVKEILETDICFTESRHSLGQRVFTTMAQFAPAYGMTGTLIGLINMLRKLENPDSLGPSMAVALVTTFYGVVLANLIFMPIAHKLKLYSEQEILRKEMFIEGILAIQSGENPRIIRDKLEAYISKNALAMDKSKTHSDSNETFDNLEPIANGEHYENE